MDSTTLVLTVTARRWQNPIGRERFGTARSGLDCHYIRAEAERLTIERLQFRVFSEILVRNRDRLQAAHVSAEQRLR